MAGDKPDKITAAEFANWIPAKAAADRVFAVQGEQAYKTILQRLSDGIFRAIAETAVIDSDRGDLVEILPSTWKTVMDKNHPWALPLWKTGDAAVTLIVGSSSRFAVPQPCRFYNVRFEPAGIDKMAPPPEFKGLIASLVAPAKEAAPAIASPQSAIFPAQPLRAAPNRAGRPAQEFWEDMVIAATKAIWYEATLQPKTIAEVQRWMADWAIAHGHDPGETALKERARRVFLASQE